jgi:hypothetical protein
MYLLKGGQPAGETVRPAKPPRGFANSRLYKPQPAADYYIFAGRWAKSCRRRRNILRKTCQA